MSVGFVTTKELNRYDNERVTPVLDAVSEFKDMYDVDNVLRHAYNLRGKNLGNSYTDEQKMAISEGTFDGIYTADFWDINDVNWRIADLDYFYECLSSPLYHVHHAIIVPDKCLIPNNAPMNDTNTTAGGYKATKMRSTYLPQCVTMFENAFGAEHTVANKDYISNAVTNEKVTGAEFIDTLKMELMSEIHFYGCTGCGNHQYAYMNWGTSNKAFSLFNSRVYQQNGENAWFRDVVNAANFANVHDYGGADHYRASYTSLGVRPFGILV